MKFPFVGLDLEASSGSLAAFFPKTIMVGAKAAEDATRQAKRIAIADFIFIYFDGISYVGDEIVCFLWKLGGDLGEWMMVALLHIQTQLREPQCKI